MHSRLRKTVEILRNKVTHFQAENSKIADKLLALENTVNEVDLYSTTEKTKLKFYKDYLGESRRLHSSQLGDRLFIAKDATSERVRLNSKQKNFEKILEAKKQEKEESMKLYQNCLYKLNEVHNDIQYNQQFLEKYAGVMHRLFQVMGKQTIDGCIRKYKEVLSLNERTTSQVNYLHIEKEQLLKRKTDLGNYCRDSYNYCQSPHRAEYESWIFASKCERNELMHDSLKILASIADHFIQIYQKLKKTDLNHVFLPNLSLQIMKNLEGLSKFEFLEVLCKETPLLMVLVEKQILQCEAEMFHLISARRKKNPWAFKVFESRNNHFYYASISYDTCVTEEHIQSKVGICNEEINKRKQIRFANHFIRGNIKRQTLTKNSLADILNAVVYVEERAFGSIRAQAKLAESKSIFQLTSNNESMSDTDSEVQTPGSSITFNSLSPKLNAKQMIKRKKTQNQSLRTGYSSMHSFRNEHKVMGNALKSLTSHVAAFKNDKTKKSLSSVCLEIASKRCKILEPCRQVQLHDYLSPKAKKSQVLPPLKGIQYSEHFTSTRASTGFKLNSPKAQLNSENLPENRKFSVDNHINRLKKIYNIS